MHACFLKTIIWILRRIYRSGSQVSIAVHRSRVFAAYPRRPAGLSRRAVALVRDGGANPGYRNVHRSAGPAVRTQSCWLLAENKESPKKKENRTLSSFFLSPPLCIPRQPNPITAINTTGHCSSSLVPLPPLWSYIPFSISPLSLSLHNPPAPLYTPPPYIRCDSPLCPSPCSAFFFSFQDPIFRFPPHISTSCPSIFRPLLFASAPLSLCTSIALCTQAIKHAHAHTHPFRPAFYPLPPLFAARIGGSVVRD